MPKATEAFSSSQIEIPTEIVSGITRKMQEQSVVMALAQSQPQMFANAKHMVFTMEPEAEFVGEGAEKSSAEFGIAPKEGKIHKAQVTVRLNEEVRWADEDNQLLIMQTVFDSMAGANARALDYGMLHAINPLTKSVLDSLKPEALTLQATQVTATGDIQADLDNLPDSVLENYDVNGIALDRMYANELRKQRNPNTGAKVYPEVNLSLDPGNLEGLRAVTSAAVSGKRLAPAPTGIQAIIGDWSLIKFGMVRNFAIEEILYGDPDGLGDLKRHNQVAYRAEAVFSWAVMDFSGFAVLKNAGASEAAETRAKKAA